jgi:DNA-binding NtrC family response regulator
METTTDRSGTREARALETSRRPRVIVAEDDPDLRMMISVLAGLRQADWQTPIVLMTAYADREMREEARRFGVDAFFDKPFDIDDLATAVVNMTRTRLHTAPVRRYLKRGET